MTGWYSQLLLGRQARFAPWPGVVNLLAGGIVVFVIGNVLAASMEYQTWSAIAGITIWMQFIA
ncbi:MAG: hypothetical protein OSW77_05935, partial [Proteobacteria bacterium]|nr:hypothetical protein [Pseudomonadota bacterium]